MSHFETVNRLVSSFRPISLGEMDAVKLMDRMDMKFILGVDKFMSIVPELYTHYRILTISENRVFNYRTDYYDTPQFDMFFDHHKGKQQRYKVRIREYVESKLAFIEIKFRTNKGRVIKKRVASAGSDFKTFIAEHTPYEPESLQHVLINGFNRLTLVDNKMQERVTIDFNVCFRDKNRMLTLKDLVIIEIKQAKADKTSNVYCALKRNQVRSSSVSKYCIGISLLKLPSKSNNFKETILQINKLSHVEHTA